MNVESPFKAEFLLFSVNVICASLELKFEPFLKIISCVSKDVRAQAPTKDRTG